MSFFYAQKNWSYAHSGNYTDDMGALPALVPPMFRGAHGFDGTCATMEFSVSVDRRFYNASFTDHVRAFTARVNEQRYLRVTAL